MIFRTGPEVMPRRKILALAGNPTLVIKLVVYNRYIDRAYRFFAAVTLVVKIVGSWIRNIISEHVRYRSSHSGIFKFRENSI